MEYKNNRGALISNIQKVYENLDLKMPKLDTNWVPKDIDPFTVFGLFNKGMKDDNRKRIIAAFAEVFDIHSSLPTGFEGIPVLNNQMATFYAFEDDARRKPGDLDRLWQVFESAIAYARESNPESTRQFSEAYDRVLDQFGVKWNITMGLYWIRPYSFLNLDSRNRWYLSFPEFVSQDVADDVKSLKEPPKAGQFLALIEKVKESLPSGSPALDSLPDLSAKAWIESERVNKEESQKKKQEKEKSKQIAANTLGDGDVEPANYWLYAPGADASKWDDFYSEGVIGLGWSSLGDLTTYATKEDMRQKLLDVDGSDTSQKNSALAVWQFANEMKPGDVVFAKKGRGAILGRGVVESDYYYDPNFGEYPNLRKVRWTNKGEWHTGVSLAMKTLTDISDYPDLVSKISSYFSDSEGDTERLPEDWPSYTEEDFLDEVYIDQDEYRTLVNLLESKKNVILQGAPGVGKTFVAKRLAYSIMGRKDLSRVSMIQFHQSYSYEDFIMGFRPSETGGFELRKGAFYTFCKNAADDPDNDYFFIIDEINRGNLSKIFGELFMLIEADKRGPKNKLQLLYSDELFYVPENVRIIGMMNTADRSLALLDYALRRRFAFFDITPGFTSDGFVNYRQSLGSDRFDRLIQCVTDLNNRIKDDESLGEGFQIGHSFFCNISEEDLTDRKLNEIVEYEIVPLLKEYWFDDPALVREWGERLKGSIK